MIDNPIVNAVNVSKSFGKLVVLHQINLQIAKGEIVAITGASGTGKTTLLQILGSLDRPDSGEIMISGKNILSLKPKELSTFRNTNMGFVFQFHNLLPEFTALENVCMPAFIKGDSRKVAEKKAMEFMDFLNISQRAEHKPSELSGGEAQRVAIARALVNNPAVIFADEPSGNLDAENSIELHELFFKLRENFGQTFLIVTHDPILAQKSDRIIKMKDGYIVD